MPSVMDAPELIEDVETHDLILETRERPQPRRARPGCWRLRSPGTSPLRCVSGTRRCAAPRPRASHPWTGWYERTYSALPLPWPSSERAAPIAPSLGAPAQPPQRQAGGATAAVSGVASTLGGC